MHRRAAIALAALTLLCAIPAPADATHGGPIRVLSDADLVAPHWTGSGTPEDPVRLATAAPTPAGGSGIEISNTRKHVNLSGLVIAGGGTGASGSDGIRLTNVTNLTLWGSTLESNKVGVHVKRSTGVLIAATTVKTSGTGILLEESAGVTVRDNQIALNDKDVAFKLASRNVLRGNDLSIATGQVGLHFEDNASYDNAIDATNVVNGVAVRWYTGVTNAALPDVVVDLAGITNVAQIMVHNGTGVTLERAIARSGIGAGLVVHRGVAVEVVSPVVESNARGGVLVEISTSTRLTNASVRNNGLSGIEVRSGRDTTIASSVLAGNAREAVRGTNATTALVLRDVVAGPNAQQGLVADKAVDVRVERGSFSGDTLTFLGSRDVVVRDATLVGAGIVLNASATATVQNVTIAGPPRDGVFDWGSSDVRIDGARVTAPGVHGINVTKSARANVTAAVVRDAAGVGIRAAEVSGLQLHDNLVAGARNAGLALEGVPAGARVAGNVVLNATSGIRLARTESAELRSNVVTMAPGGTGIRFDDEASYNNVIPTTNVVDGAPVHWYTALVGAPDAPVRLPGVRSELAGITNVAQVMLYRSSEVALTDVVATNGTGRGIYLYRSSAVNLTRADVSDNAIAGVELHATQSSTIQDVIAARTNVGVRLSDALGNVVTRVEANGSGTGARITAGSRDNRVDAVGSDGTAAGVVDEGWNRSSLRGNNLVVDAGGAKRARAGDVVAFADATVTYRHESDRVVAQRWSWGDGAPDEPAANDTLPNLTHVYDAPGRYASTLTVTLASGLTLADSAWVEIVGPLTGPRALNATIVEGNATIRWLPPESDGARQILGYRLYRGSNETELLFVRNVTGFEANESVADEGPIVYAVAAYTAEGEGPRANATAYRVPAVTNGTDPEGNETPTTPATPTLTAEPTDGPRRPSRGTPPPREEPAADTPLAPAVAVAAILLAAILFARRR